MDVGHTKGPQGGQGLVFVFVFVYDMGIHKEPTEHKALCTCVCICIWGPFYRWPLAIDGHEHTKGSQGRRLYVYICISSTIIVVFIFATLIVFVFAFGGHRWTSGGIQRSGEENKALYRSRSL